jgi:regulator of protease activity HflC (stomatin/prohibitin superfamily)
MIDNNQTSTPLKSDDINNIPNNPDLINVNEGIQYVGSQEKILELPRGYKLWIRICSVFGVSLLLTITFIIISTVVEVNVARFPGALSFILIIIAFVGIMYSFVMVTCCNGFVTVNPNEAVVFQYFGRYLGTVKENGYFYGPPMSKTTRVSLRSNQYNGNRLKVNERDGNPVELGIIVVWRVGDTAKAIFDVTSYESFIHTQSEAAIRYIGCKYPYEPVVQGEISLRSGHEIINKELRQELEQRVKISGIIIEDARVTEISYGEEVAKMMLQKQASNATVYAKDAIVKGSADAVIKSMNEFESKGCEFTDAAKAKYITSLMSTLCMSSDVSKLMEH